MEWKHVLFRGGYKARVTVLSEPTMKQRRHSPLRFPHFTPPCHFISMFPMFVTDIKRPSPLHTKLQNEYRNNYTKLFAFPWPTCQNFLPQIIEGRHVLPWQVVYSQIKLNDSQRRFDFYPANFMRTGTDLPVALQCFIELANYCSVRCLLSE